MERETRFELATLALARRCSTTELLPLEAVLQSRLTIRGRDIPLAQKAATLKTFILPGLK